ncbi:MarR family winged helix-turn-helix transcriptional regulator [Nocardia flavorosea]|uniref:Winged helix-turn-helix transcriptional regulator n=1 Tax=Nocardia flavorosea TaxID=53429 RepID=A0A846YM55_9NOCA|nr:MarR family winged helix-turn-helix transcriptional regulator [Nocardia flavorosea]NKY58690.1 winged helix-turn-helix transcriptional regulator [Nocardia flavorosea]
MSTPESPSLLKLLTLASAAVEGELNADLRARLSADVRPAHYAVFRYLDPAGSRVGELAQAAGMTQQSMGELVAQLESVGLVRRQVDPADRRARQVVCTPAGRAALALAGERIAGIEQRITRAVGETGMRDLLNLLTQVVNLLDGGRTGVPGELER